MRLHPDSLPPEVEEEPDPAPLISDGPRVGKRAKGRRTYERAPITRESLAAQHPDRPAWMSDPRLLPRKPPGRQ